METNTPQNKEYLLGYYGNGSEYFGIVIVNWLLTVLTLGLYYPWAKARELEYLYGTTEFEGDNFTFHGTGKEMFIGFIKVVLIFAGLLAVMGIFILMEMPGLGGLIFYLGFLSLVPLAIHGSYRYRMSRTSWRGIRFGYRGDRGELLRLFFKGLFLTIITLGIYGAWFAVDLRNYVLRNVRMGGLEFDWQANGLDYLILNIKGYFLTIFTLGIYVFWWQKDLFEFYVNNLSLYQDDKEVRFTSTATGSEFFGLMIVNFLILIFTFGLGFPWVVTRTLEFIFERIHIEGNIDFSSVRQTEEEFYDATGEDMADFFDLDLVI